MGGASTDFGNRWSFTSEPWATPWIVENADPSKVLLRGNQRAYLTRRGGQSIQYEKMRLLGKTLRYTVDVSQVGCGCNAALYLVAMRQPDGWNSRYCDINVGDPEPCLEIDLFEGNAKALATTLHTEGGEAADGKCNQWGCAASYGPWDSNCAFGIGSPNLDSSRPFEMAARFENNGVMTVDAGQDGVWRRLWEKRLAGNNAPEVPLSAFAKVKASLEEDGLVLVTSLWAADGDGMSWLDGGCNAQYPHCDLNSATAVFSDLRIEENGPIWTQSTAVVSASQAVPRPPGSPPNLSPNVAFAGPISPPSFAPLTPPTATSPQHAVSRGDSDPHSAIHATESSAVSRDTGVISSVIPIVLLTALLSGFALWLRRGCPQATRASSTKDESSIDPIEGSSQHSSQVGDGEVEVLVSGEMPTMKTEPFCLGISRPFRHFQLD